jgi:lantibiotic biosynthesis protein
MQQIAKSYLHKLNNIIRHSGAGTISGTGFLSGKSSPLLYYLELYLATEEATWLQYITGLQQNLLQELNNNEPGQYNNAYVTGIADAIYICHRLQQHNLLLPGLTAWQQNAAAFLTSEAALLFKNNRFCRRNGIFGLLHLLLLKAPQQYTAIITDLLLKAVPGETLPQFTAPLRQNPAQTGATDLGAANGLCGILQILANAAGQGFQQYHPPLHETIRTGAHFILKHKMDISYAENMYSFFPAMVDPHSNFIQSSNKLAWHNSDLNHLYLFYRLAGLFNDHSYGKLAHMIGMQTTARKTTEETMITQACVQFGSAGVALQYKKIFELTGLPYYQQAYDFWIEQTILLLEKELQQNAYAGKENNLMEGLTGIALVLTGFVYPHRGQWEQLVFP